jgi:hypothetical protein
MQIAEINVDGKMLAFKASGMTQITYDSLFRGRNFLNDIMSLRDIRSDIDAAGDDMTKVNISTDDLRVFANVCYTMRYQAMSSSEKKAFRIKYPTAYDWLDALNTFDIYTILPQVMDLWNLDSVSTSKLEEKKAKPVER